jgi:hypothetical protein
MLELMSYGLTGLTAMLVISFCFSYKDEVPPTRKKSSHGLMNDASVDSPVIETGERSPGGAV